MTNARTLTLNASSRNPLDFNIKTLSKDLFDKTAEAWAKEIAYKKEGDIFTTDLKGRLINSKNMPTQLRRFYDELVMWNERAAQPNTDFKDIEPFVHMMKSKVAYAKGRDNVDATFQNFINTLIGQIDDQKTLNNAKLFMEAMMGFYKQFRPTK